MALRPCCLSRLRATQETRLSKDLKEATIFYDEQKLDIFMGILENHVSYQAPTNIDALLSIVGDRHSVDLTRTSCSLQLSLPSLMRQAETTTVTQNL
ncbi:hypothetical protein V8B55DRAFT_1552230, partial [Mucor lusitanicus]